MAIPRGIIKKKVEEQWGGRPEATDVAAIPDLVPQTGAGGQCLLQVLQDEIDRR
jgi:hypothetical protein